MVIDNVYAIIADTYLPNDKTCGFSMLVLEKRTRH